MKMRFMIYEFIYQIINCYYAIKHYENIPTLHKEE